MNKINILHIRQNSKIGGIQQQILSLFSAYNKEVINPIFCCLDAKDEIGSEIENLGTEVISLNRPRSNKFSASIVIELYKLMKKRHIHVVRTHGYRANLYGRIAAWMAGVPVIIASIHNNYRKDKRLERRIANRILARITDRIITVSESITNDVIKYDKIDPSKILVIPNGVDTVKFAPREKSEKICKDLSIKEKDKIIGFVGRLVPAKGIEYLIEAASYLKKQYENLKVIITGDGYLLDGLRQKAEELGINDIIVFTGKRRDIPDILSCINIFVMPSIAEGLPNSLLEAMAMGKPVIATEAGGTPEIIKNEFNGLLVPPGNSKGIAEAIMILFENTLLAANISQKARDFIIENYGITAIARKWESLYQSLLTEKRQFFN